MADADLERAASLERAVALASRFQVVIRELDANLDEAYDALLVVFCGAAAQMIEHGELDEGRFARSCREMLKKSQEKRAEKKQRGDGQEPA